MHNFKKTKIKITDFQYIRKYTNYKLKGRLKNCIMIMLNFRGKRQF